MMQHAAYYNWRNRAGTKEKQAKTRIMKAASFQYDALLIIRFELSGQWLDWGR